MLECKTYLFKEEFCALLNIPKNQSERKLNELLEWLKFFFNYDFIKGKGTPHIITIKEQYAEYEPLPRKTKVPEIKAFYEAETDHILQYKPLNTGANVAREIEAKNNKYNHKDGTIANYIRPYIKARYEVNDKVWCKVNYDLYCYEPIDEQELKYLNSLFNKYLSSNTTADIISEVEAGYINKEEGYNKLKGHYNDAMKEFKDHYGFRPYKAGYLKNKTWTDEEEL